MEHFKKKITGFSELLTVIFLLSLMTGCPTAKSEAGSSTIKEDRWTRLSSAPNGQAFPGDAITTDASGNSYVTGWTWSSMDSQTLSGSSDLFVTKYDITGTRQWTRLSGVASKSTSGYGITTDYNGNIYVTGDTTGSLDGQTFTGLRNVFVIKYDAAGTKLWTRLLGGTPTTSCPNPNTIGYGITADMDCNIYVTGYTNVDLDGQSANNNSAGFIIKYNSAGVKQWTRLLTAPNDPYESHFIQGSAITADTGGNIYVTGHTNVDINTGSVQYTVGTNSGYLFVIKYDSSGTMQWGKYLGVHAKDVEGNGITLDSNNNIYVTGYTNADLDGQTLTGSEDSFIIKYNPTGTRLWTTLLGAAQQNTIGTGITSDSSGNAYVTGYTDINAAGKTTGSLDGQTLSGFGDAFVTEYNPSGARLWTKLFGNASSYASGVNSFTHSNGITLDAGANIFITGTTNGNLDGQTITGSQNVFVTKIGGNVIKAGYAIGDTGPSGVGIVFYITNGGLHGLEAAPSGWNGTSVDPTSVWSNVDSIEIGAASQGRTIGTGLANSNAIIAQSGHTSSAAKLCRDYHGGGKTDWFLPSRDEINQINVQIAAVVGISNNPYWSSTESDSRYGYSVNIISNSAGDCAKYLNTNRIHPVRAF
jgi:hypothetical protein